MEVKDVLAILIWRKFSEQLTFGLKGEVELDGLKTTGNFPVNLQELPTASRL
jgi:hypothetical protein